MKRPLRESRSGATRRVNPLVHAVQPVGTDALANSSGRETERAELVKAEQLLPDTARPVSALPE